MKKEKNNKLSLKKVVENNLFMLRICYKAAPGFLIYYIFEILRDQLVVFFEHTLVIQYILESAEFHRPFRNVAIIVIGLVIFLCFSILYSAYYYQKVYLVGRPKIVKEMKLMLYEKARVLDLECYDNPDYYNNFILSVTEAEKQIDRTLELIRMISTGVTILLTSGIYFIFMDAASILFVLVSFFTTFFLSKVLNQINYKLRIEKNAVERKRAYVHRVFYLNDYAKELRLNPNVSKKLFEDFDQTNHELYQIEKKYVKKKFVLDYARQYLCNDFINDVLYITYLVFKAAVLHTISYSSIVVLYNSSWRVKRGLRLFTDVYPYANETALYVDKIREFLSYEPKINSIKGLPVPEKPGEIDLKNVAFAYTEKDGNIINHINLKIKPCEKIALVGYNGAGKTTLIKLIMRLYDCSEGVIALGGIDIKDYDVEAYRSRIGAIFQDYKLYAANVKENVLLDQCEDIVQANEKTDIQIDKQVNINDKIEDSLKLSGFTERLKKLEQGLYTPLTTEFEEKGVNLSGGESQKIAISRVFYKDANLIILDEPSSALDPIAEYNLYKSMHNAAKNKAVIFISHRLSTTRHADRIIMLENGRIAEEGSHEELLKLDGKYAQMWKVQAGQYMMEEKKGVS